MENYSVQVPPYTVGPEAYKKIEKQKEKLYNFTYNNKGGSLKWIV